MLGLGSSGIQTRAWLGIEIIGLIPPLKRSTCGYLLEVGTEEHSVEDVLRARLLGIRD